MEANLRAIEILLREFPNAEVGLDNQRPYARHGEKLYGCLFGYVKNTREPVAIIEFPGKFLTTHNYKIVKPLVAEWSATREE